MSIVPLDGHRHVQSWKNGCVLFNTITPLNLIPHNVCMVGPTDHKDFSRCTQFSKHDAQKGEMFKEQPSR